MPSLTESNIEDYTLKLLEERAAVRVYYESRPVKISLAGSAGR
jgi:hypothetical protein